MASTQEPCCGHDHVGGDELWLTVDELIDVVADTLRTVLDLPARALTDADRVAIRARYDERERIRRDQAAKVSARRPDWRERAWGGR